MFDESEIGDIMTNLLACAANQFDQIDRVNAVLSKLVNDDKTYEFYFNESQMMMKKGLFEEALDSLLRSFEVAKEDNSDQTDAARFKI